MTTKTNNGNIFALLGFDAEKAADLQLRSKLLIEITERVSPMQLTQQKGAELLGINQPRFNDLVKNRINKFSVDALVKILSKLGHTIAVIPKASVEKTITIGYYSPIVMVEKQPFSWQVQTANIPTAIYLSEDSTTTSASNDEIFSPYGHAPTSPKFDRTYLEDFA